MILETTGLADPAPVAFTFFANPWIASRYRLDSIVCVCDTRYVLQVRGSCLGVPKLLCNPWKAWGAHVRGLFYTLVHVCAKQGVGGADASMGSPWPPRDGRDRLAHECPRVCIAC